MARGLICKKPLPEIKHLLCVGTISGILPIKYNQFKLQTKEGPYEYCFQLMVYDIMIWILSVVMSFQAYKECLNKFPFVLQTLLIVISSTNLYCIFNLTVARKTILQLINIAFKLNQKSTELNFKLIHLALPFLPLLLIMFKIILDFDWIVYSPNLHYLVFLHMVYYVYTISLIYFLILYAEKFTCGIIKKLDLDQCSSTSDSNLKAIMLYFLETEEFVRSISHSFGVPCLLIGIYAVSVNLINSNLRIFEVLPNLHKVSLVEFAKEAVHTGEWYYPLYLMLCFCYRSHRMNLEVQKLKSAIEEILQINEGLSKESLNVVHLFQNTVNSTTVYFSALGSVQFNLHLVMVVVNSFITYVFAISPIINNSS